MRYKSADRRHVADDTLDLDLGQTRIAIPGDRP
jgi:hypothetical protein